MLRIVLIAVAVAIACRAGCVLDKPLSARQVRSMSSVDTIILHHTALESVGESIATLRRRGLSYHFLVDPDGRVIEAVPVRRVALHASGANRRSIGVSMVGGNTAQWAPGDKQWTAAQSLVGHLARTYRRIKYLIGHGDVRDSNRGEPYGVDFHRFLSQLQSEQGVRLTHPGLEDEPLRGFRAAALKRWERPLKPRGAVPPARLPQAEAVTCDGNRKVLYSVPPPALRSQ